ncbi:MAG: 3,4-dehydroadipyl-CoA semialdehyde dehydrogenase, partial [Candidatus Dormibacteraeota bacterium]|nr:3,4-dehydroadipyl-CoA semialdehyde dehydrogenase [Candidatus Dormibacteraeota bacterium]
MTGVLGSYVAGRWVTPSGDGTLVLDAATGEPVTRVSTTGVDMRAAVEHARSVGGPALRRLSFPERTALLKALATHLDSRKDAYHELSLHTGATRRDGMVDIDGGIATLFAFSGIGKREMPDGRLLLDGEAIPMGRNGTFVAQHVYTPIRGAAVQINAFNFPVWGMLEKLAPAVLAGVPSVVKPASQTAYVTEAVVRDIVESAILPEGALQLISGSAGDLFDHLDGRDLIAFTGSSSTAATIRSHPAVTVRAARFTAETDSLNACILGPDADAGSEEFALFTKEVAREMTVKAGQKCTAIRRALVPEALVDDVVSALRSRLDRVVVGNPRNESVTMGALAGLHQRDEVRGAVQQLRLAADVVAGDPDAVHPVDADSERGAFMSPLLL